MIAEASLTQDRDPFWNKPIRQVIGKLRTGSGGLTSAEAEDRLRVYGQNDAAAVKRPSRFLRFLSRFRNPLVIILLAASGFAAATGDIASFVIVSTIVALSVLMDFFQELRAEDALDALRDKVALRVRVARDGHEVILAAAQLVPGDVVYLRAGDLVPADGRLLAAKDLFINQALVTGESYPVEKCAAEQTEPTAELTRAVNVALAGTSVLSGTATLLVCRTGRATVLGQLARTLAGKHPPTAFEVGSQRFSILLLRITVLLVLFVLTESILFKREWLESLMFALALAVGLTPELLPMIFTVTLSRGAARLAHQNVIVKRLPAIHNLGAMDVLCTDKTGTLTEARVQLVHHFDVFGAESDHVFELAFLNSFLEAGLKNPLDEAILAHRQIDVSAWRKIDENSFDFERRRVSVLVERDAQRLLVVKGAPEDLLRLSAYFEDVDGSAQPLTPEFRAKLQAEFEKLGAEGFRCLGIASRPVAHDHDNALVSDETELVFSGFAVFMDPPKASAGAAIRTLADAGVAVIVLTGDNEQVAAHLCRELGIPAKAVVTGAQLDSWSDEALIARLSQANLFCRVTPQQKLRVLLALRRSGKTVGFLGDGINDAPALHAADVGISVDTAVDVAKAAAEVILLDKDLGVLHNGVMEGRRTVVNVEKYILMASSANFGNILSMALAGLVLPFVPLLPIQVLLTNLLYDIAQAGLPFDKVDHEVVEKPVHWTMPLIERFMLVMGPISTLFDIVTIGTLIFIFQADQALFRTGWFVESLVTQILMIFAVRTHRHLFASRPHPLVTALAIGMAIFTIALPFIPMGDWFQFVRLPPLYFGFLFVAVVGFLVMIEVVKRAFYAARVPHLIKLKRRA